MKDSNKIVITIAGATVVIVIALVIVARVFFGGVIKSVGAGNFVMATGSQVEKDFDVKDFKNVSASGAWRIELKQDSAYSVKVFVPESIASYLDVHVDNGTLDIAFRPGTSVTGGGFYRATVTMPSLAAVSLSGAVKVEFGGFFGGPARRKELRCGRRERLQWAIPEPERRVERRGQHPASGSHDGECPRERQRGGSGRADHGRGRSLG